MPRIMLFSVLDKAVGAYLPPFPARARGEAIRMFGNTVNDRESQIAAHPGDYILFYLGEWDDSTGLYHTGEPERVVGAIELQVVDGPDPRSSQMDIPPNPGRLINRRM